MTPITESQFYMWRALFALIHADNLVASEEIEYAMGILDEMNFSEEQRHVLCEDLRTPQNAAKMFAQITRRKDQARFFKFAGELVWIDGQYAREEQELMLLLEAEHLKDVDINTLIGNMSLQFEDASERAREDNSVKNIVSSFRDAFFIES